MTEKNERYHHTKGACPVLDDPRLYRDIGAFGKGPHA